MKKSDGGLPAAARERRRRRRRRRLFSHPKLAFSLRCCPCASACSPISIGSAPSCRERGHQLSRGSLGTRISLSIFARCFFRSGPPSIDFFLFRSSCHFSLPRPKQNAGPLLRHRPPQPAGGPRGPQAQAQEARPVAQQLLHGCQVPGLLPDHRRVQQLADGRRLPGVLGGAVHAHGREGEAYRGLLVQEEGRLERELECVDGGGQGGEEREREKRGTEMIRSRNFPAAPSTSLSLSPSLDLLAPPT